MLGLGDKEHNRRVREERERRRPVLTDVKEDIPLWNIWVYYMTDEGRKAETAGSSGTGRIPVFREIHAERRKADGK